MQYHEVGNELLVVPPNPPATNRRIDDFIQHVFLLGRGFSRHRWWPERVVENVRQEEQALVSSSFRPWGFSRNFGVQYALEGVFLFGAAYENYGQSEQRHNYPLSHLAMDALARSQDRLARAFLSLAPRQRQALFFGTEMLPLLCGEQEWLTHMAGAFSAARVIKAFLSCGVAVRLATPEQDLGGIDLFAFPQPLMPNGLAVQVGTDKSTSYDGWYSVGLLRDDFSPVGKDFQRKVRRFIASTESFNRSLSVDFAPVFVAVKTMLELLNAEAGTPDPLENTIRLLVGECETSLVKDWRQYCLDPA